MEINKQRSTVRSSAGSYYRPRLRSYMLKVYNYGFWRAINKFVALLFFKMAVVTSASK